ALIDDEAINPSFVDPAIALVDILAVRYKGSELLPILYQSRLALVSAQTSLAGQALAAELARLMQAIKPWILEGAPQHYSDLGLTLYRDLADGQLWLQKGGVVENPYGGGESEAISWRHAIDALGPDSSKLDSSEFDSPENIQRMTDVEPMADSHAGHR
ncbi:MAG: hypothetical protein JKX81_10480, partial [Arenicella sp.]|nr:hypothetical protein [Arenicella sp.]